MFFQYKGDQKTSTSKEDKRNLAPAVKERIPAGSTHEELFTEVEKQYVVVTAPKVSPKPKKPVKDSSSIASKIKLDTETQSRVSEVDGDVEGGNFYKRSCCNNEVLKLLIRGWLYER